MKLSGYVIYDEESDRFFKGGVYNYWSTPGKPGKVYSTLGAVRCVLGYYVQPVRNFSYLNAVVIDLTTGEKVDNVRDIFNRAIDKRMK